MRKPRWRPTQPAHARLLRVGRPRDPGWPHRAGVGEACRGSSPCMPRSSDRTHSVRGRCFVRCQARMSGGRSSSKRDDLSRADVAGAFDRQRRSRSRADASRPARVGRTGRPRGGGRERQSMLLIPDLAGGMLPKRSGWRASTLTESHRFELRCVRRRRDDIGRYHGGHRHNRA